MVANLGGVEKLELRYAMVHGLDQTMDIVYAFPSLRTLTLIPHFMGAHGRLKLQPTVTRFAQGPQFQLDILELSHDADDYIRWILARDPIPPIRDLRCSLH
jgi:hypothetical protein